LKALCEDSQANAGCVSVEMQRLKALARPVVSGLVFGICKRLILSQICY